MTWSDKGFVLDRLNESNKCQKYMEKELKLTHSFNKLMRTLIYLFSYQLKKSIIYLKKAIDLDSSYKDKAKNVTALIRLLTD